MTATTELATRLRDNAEHIHARGVQITAAHLLEAAAELDRLDRQVGELVENLEARIESLQVWLKSIMDAYEQASGGKSPTVGALIAAVHRGAR